MASVPRPVRPPADRAPEAEVPAVLAGLIDDAALFPPANVGMADAVLAHRRYRAGGQAALVGRFLCAAGRIGELRAALDTEPGRTARPVRPGPSGPARTDQPADTGPLRIGVIGDAELVALPRALADVAADPRLVLEAVEIPLPAGTSGRQELTEATRRAVAALPTGLLGYVEVPRTAGWEAALDTLSAVGRGAKLRTGGSVAAAVPSVAELAAFLSACAARLLPVKCTAGLHHAVRRSDPETAAEQHGFLNVLVAAGAAVVGADPTGPLSERDGAVLAGQARALDPGPARGLLTSFGSCSIAEPVDELRALGLLP
jgi:hypothetical protein